MAKPRIKMPSSASKGEVFEVKTLISHKMESGQRKDKEGNPIPRKIINKFSVKYMGKDAFAMELYPAISANPYITFYMKAEESGPVEFTWVEDGGNTITETKELSVS